MKKLPFVCPLCGGKLVSAIFRSGTDDYYMSKTGKRYKTPFRKASSHLSDGDGVQYINCINYPKNCDFTTNGELDFEDDLKYKYIITYDENDNFELYCIGDDK